MKQLCLLTIVVALALPGCGKKRSERYRIYVVPEVTKAAVQKPLPRKPSRYEKLYKAPGRLKSSGHNVYSFELPKGLARAGKSFRLMVLSAKLPLGDLARFFKDRPDKYAVITEKRGYKVVALEHLRGKKLNEYQGPTMYLNYDQQGNSRVVVYPPKAPLAEQTKTKSSTLVAKNSTTSTKQPTLPTFRTTNSRGKLPPRRLPITNVQKVFDPTTQAHRLPERLQKVIGKWNEKHPKEPFQF